MDHKFISNLSELDRDILNKKLNDAKEDPALEENKEEIIDAIKEIKKVNAKASKAAEGSKKESIPVKSTTIEISPESFKPTTEADKAEAAENLVSRLTEMKTKLDAAENLKNSEMKKSDTYSDERNESSLNLENVKKSKAARFKQYWNSEEGAYWRQGDPRAMRLTEEQAFEESLEDNEDFQKLKNTHEFGIARSYRMQQDTVKAAVESYGKLSREYNALEKELNNKYPEAASTYRLKIAREAASKRK
ncbi:MAG: hypothetical protein NTZ68_00480 [Candidatus Dependentiae bacterium]|nr:hypothetical protein [Candidatus Dependentiae bacterium]